MAQITFTITDKEIQEKAKHKLGKRQTREILEFVENDTILWNEIEKSIHDAILIVSKK